jgi:hypothetical protein
MIVLVTFWDTLASTIEEGRAASKSPHLKFGYFFLCPGAPFLGLVWRNRNKISQIINDYLYLQFFLFIILWPPPSTVQGRVEEPPSGSAERQTLHHLRGELSSFLEHQAGRLKNSCNKYTLFALFCR